MLEALLLADRIAVMRDGRLIARRHAGGADGRRAATTTSRELMADAAPAGRASGRAAAERPTHDRVTRASPRPARACPTISAAMSRSASTALALGLAISLPLALLAMRRPALRAAAARRRQHRADHPGARAARAVLSAAAGAGGAVRAAVRRRLLRARLPAVGAGADALQHAAGAAEHGHRPAGRRSGAQRGRARRRHDARGNRCSWSSCRSRCR